MYPSYQRRNIRILLLMCLPVGRYRTYLKPVTSKGCIVIIYIVIFLHYLLYIEFYMLQGLESEKPYPLGTGMLI